MKAAVPALAWATLTTNASNLAERALRGLVVGRKNHYGSRSQRGAGVSALFYSLIGSASR